MKRVCYALFLLILSAPVLFTAGAQSVVAPKKNRTPEAAPAAKTLVEDTRATILLPASDPDGDAVTVVLVAPPRHGSVTVSGISATYVPHPNFAGIDYFTYRVGDGTAMSRPARVQISVTPVDDAPLMLAEPGDVSIREGEPFLFRYVAADVEGDAVSYRLVDGPEGVEFDEATGELRWTPTYTQEGVYSIRVAASDGELETVSHGTVTVLNTEVYAGTLSPIHMTAPFVSQASGTAEVTYDDVAVTLTIDATFSGLSSDRLSAGAYLGPFGEDRDVLVPLELVDDASNPGLTNGRILFPGVFGTPSDEFPLGLISVVYPDITPQMVIDSLNAGKAYLIVGSADHPDGELRVHLRSISANSAPEAASIDAPATVMIEGDPQSVGLEITWSAPVDPDGDPTRQVFGIWNDVELTDLRTQWVDDGTHLRSYTVDELAGLFDDLGGGGTGGSQTIYVGVETTDGAHIATSNLVAVNLVRGLITATDGEGLVPDAFMLRGNFPNPFNPSTTVQFDLPDPAEVEVYVTDLLGRVVLTVPPQAMSAGLRRQIPLDASILASGIYIYRVTARTDATTHVATGTMTLLK